jgi:hypothetical protein
VKTDQEFCNKSYAIFSRLSLSLPYPSLEFKCNAISLVDYVSNKQPNFIHAFMFYYFAVVRILAA